MFWAKLSSRIRINTTAAEILVRTGTERRAASGAASDGDVGRKAVTAAAGAVTVLCGVGRNADAAAAFAAAVLCGNGRNADAGAAGAITVQDGVGVNAPAGAAAGGLSTAIRRLIAENSRAPAVNGYATLDCGSENSRSPHRPYRAAFHHR